MKVNPRLIAWGVVGLLVIAAGVAVLTPAAPVRADIGDPDLQQLQSQGAHIVDVRSAGEFAMGHIPGAENVPMDVLTQTAVSWDKSQAIVVYCASGARSSTAAQWLSANGFTKVYNLKSGLLAWTGPVTKDTFVSGSVKTNGKPVFIDFFSPT